MEHLLYVPICSQELAISLGASYKRKSFSKEIKGYFFIEEELDENKTKQLSSLYGIESYEAKQQEKKLLSKWKTTIAILFIIWSVFSFRPFCKYFCPLGAIYSFFNKVAIFGIKVDYTKCTNCQKCTKECKMNPKSVNSTECIRCGKCLSKCDFGALNS